VIVFSLTAWFVVVFSARVAFLGNPIFTMLRDADDVLLERADQILMNGRSPATPSEVEFFSRFSRYVLIELVIVLLELTLLIYLCVSRTMLWLAVALLVKDVAMIVFSGVYAGTRDDPSLIGSLIRLPSWMVMLDRISALFSAAGFLVVFLHINGIVVS